MQDVGIGLSGERCTIHSTRIVYTQGWFRNLVVYGAACHTVDVPTYFQLELQLMGGLYSAATSVHRARRPWWPRWVRCISRDVFYRTRMAVNASSDKHHKLATVKCATIGVEIFI